MMAPMPNLFSLRVKYPARIRIPIVTGTAAMVRANSASFLCLLATITMNWMVKPRKKKKSNFNSAM